MVGRLVNSKPSLAERTVHLHGSPHTFCLVSFLDVPVYFPFDAMGRIWNLIKPRHDR